VDQSKLRFVNFLPNPVKDLLRWLWRNLWGFGLYAIFLTGYIPSHGLRKFLYRYLFGVKIGRRSIIHWQTRWFKPSGIRIGNECNIGNNAFLDGRCGLTIGNRVATGAEIMIYTLQHDIDSADFGTAGGPVIIEDYVYIGPRAIILPNVHVGCGAVIAAGAVVTSDVSDFAVVGGVPAKFLRERSRDLDYKPDFAIPFQ
jgi:putative colanic acid biosynthesis acetyltransferase WcaF